MKIKTSELTGIALDWAVGFARCLEANGGKIVQARDLMGAAMRNGMASPSTDWAQGGEIVEREGINTSVNYQDDAFGEVMYRVGWKASYWNDSIPGTPGFLVWAYGDTALIAAMRCIVMAKLGKEIEIPQELLRNKS